MPQKIWKRLNSSFLGGFHRFDGLAGGEGGGDLQLLLRQRHHQHFPFSIGLGFLLWWGLTHQIVLSNICFKIFREQKQLPWIISINHEIHVDSLWLHSGASSLAKHGGAYFMAVYVWCKTWQSECLSVLSQSVTDGVHIVTAQRSWVKTWAKSMF